MFFQDYLSQFNNEIDIILYYIKIRYKKEKPFCNHCGCSEHICHRLDRPKFFQCNNCNNSFSIFKDTIFEKTSTDLRKWFYAIHLIINNKKGISGYCLQREIHVTYKTAWRILKQIRLAMVMHRTEDDKLFHAYIEVDETYVGGKPRKDNTGMSDGTSKRGRGTKKQPIIGIYDRENKCVYAKVASMNSKGQKLSGKQLLDTIKETCKYKNTTFYTDEFSGYNSLHKDKSNIHLVVDHNKMFVDGDIHTNNIESFWGTLKRGIIGTYHHISVGYMQNYVNEFCFRHNHREGKTFFIEEIFAIIVEQSALKKVYEIKEEDIPYWTQWIDKKIKN